jgi:hypothetical protein
VISSIIATRLLKVLAGSNVDRQLFTTVGCQEAIHCIHVALALRRIHGLETVILFVDLVKASDTINQKTGCKVQVNIGEEKRSAHYKTGVQKGKKLALSSSS